jgi:hypothetical protein
VIQRPPRLTAKEAEDMLEEYKQAYPERVRQIQELKAEIGKPCGVCERCQAGKPHKCFELPCANCRNKPCTCPT